MTAIVVAPFSNSGIRNWPKSSYRKLIALLLDRIEPEVTIKVVGTASQTPQANEVVRPFPTARVINACGRLSWPETVAELSGAACVIGNNSSVTHLGGFLGVPTVCIFAGSHQREEWRALGPSVVLVTRAIGCSPCQLDHGQVSPYDKACLRQITPETVADAARTVMARSRAGRLEAE